MYTSEKYLNEMSEKTKSKLKTAGKVAAGAVAVGAGVAAAKYLKGGLGRMPKGTTLKDRLEIAKHTRRIEKQAKKGEPITLGKK